MNDSTPKQSGALTEPDAPLVVRSSGDSVAFFGALLTALVAGVVWLWPGAPAVWALVLVGLVFVVGVLWPLHDYLQNVVVCDDKGLIFGGLWRKRRIAWAEIEALYLLASPDAIEDNARPMIMINGLPFGFAGTSDERAQLIERIERGAGLRLEKRDFIPLGSSFVLPATFDYAEKRSYKRAAIGIALTVNLSLWALLIGLANWSLWTPWLLAAALLVSQLRTWSRYFRRKWRREQWGREHQSERIVADQTGLTFSRAGAPDVSLDWPQITRLERDCTRSQWKRVHRVQGHREGREQTITFYGFDTLTRLLRERCDLDWQETPHYQQIVYGLSRGAEALTLSADRESATLQRGYWRALWQCAAQVWVVCASWNVVASWALGAKLLAICLTPPLAIPLGVAIAIAISQRRVWTRCDGSGLTHQGWGRARTLKWSEIEACGGAVLWDWVRARNGRAIRISHWPILGGAVGRQQLRLEIERRAPHAEFCWDFCQCREHAKTLSSSPSVN